MKKIIYGFLFVGLLVYVGCAQTHSTSKNVATEDAAESVAGVMIDEAELKELRHKEEAYNKLRENLKIEIEHLIEKQDRKKKKNPFGEPIATPGPVPRPNLGDGINDPRTPQKLDYLIVQDPSEEEAPERGARPEHSVHPETENLGQPEAEMRERVRDRTENARKPANEVIPTPSVPKRNLY